MFACTCLLRAFRLHRIVEANPRRMEKDRQQRQVRTVQAQTICAMGHPENKEMSTRTGVPKSLTPFFWLSNSLDRSARGLAWTKLIRAARLCG
jgi:hypothetical protein